MTRLGEALMRAWETRGKALVAGNGGSAADAMHLAEELCVRFMKNRRALAAIALCDPTVITCAANDFGYDEVFARQVEALGNRGDVLIVFSTSGNSPNVLRAIERAKSLGLVTAAFLGRDGGKARGSCDIELIVPAQTPHRIQEGHKLLYHTLCEWVEERVAT
jgi:D-sedoheptulose 7-phosphate isomerase